MNNKKIWLTSMSIVAAATPLVAVVSCAGKNDDAIKSATSDKPKTLDQALSSVKKDASDSASLAIENIKNGLEGSDIVNDEWYKTHLSSMVDKDKLSVEDAGDNIYLHVNPLDLQKGIQADLSSEVNGDKLDITITLTCPEINNNIKEEFKTSIGGWASNTDLKALDDAKAESKKVYDFLSDENNNVGLAKGFMNLFDLTPGAKKLTAEAINVSDFTIADNLEGDVYQYADEFDYDGTQLIGKGLQYRIENIKKSKEDGTEISYSVKLLPVVNSLNSLVPYKTDLTEDGFKDVDTYIKDAANESVYQDELKVLKDKYGIGDKITEKDITADGQPWVNGIGWFSFQESTSFLINLAEKLGWNMPKDKHYVISNEDKGLNTKHQTMVDNINNMMKQVPKTTSYEDGESLTSWSGDKSKDNDLSVYLDPVSSDGTLGTRLLKALGIDYESTIGANSSDGNFGTGDNAVQFTIGASYHDGDHPGRNDFKLWTKDGASYSGHTSDKFNKIYNKLSGDDLDSFKELVYTTLLNVKSKYGDSKNLLDTLTGYTVNSVITPDFAGVFNFFGTTDFDKDKLFRAIDELNNGSHYLPAVKIFTTGINLSTEELAPAGKQDLEGLLKLEVLSDIKDWAHDVKGGSSFTQSSNPTSSSDEIYDLPQ